MSCFPSSKYVMKLSSSSICNGVGAGVGAGSGAGAGITVGSTVEEASSRSLPVFYSRVGSIPTNEIVMTVLNNIPKKKAQPKIMKNSWHEVKELLTKMMELILL